MKKSIGPVVCVVQELPTRVAFFPFRSSLRYSFLTRLPRLFIRTPYVSLPAAPLPPNSSHFSGGFVESICTACGSCSSCKGAASNEALGQKLRSGKGGLTPEFLRGTCHFVSNVKGTSLRAVGL
ncbi:hypothetical protein R1flu_025347 [Riccia fluitans]|uniref:Uncharacterized protein n=1 Tax=Riccia fluitans TaxID=41844 RepID=A0ABD1XXI0_9MARC